MVDVFGGSGTLKNRRGPRGPIGPRGLPGSIRDFCQWLPNTAISNLQKYDENGSFFIQDPSQDLKMSGKEVRTWVSRSVKGWNLVADMASSDLVKLSKRYALGFKKNRYVSDDMVVLETFPGRSAFICVTFKVFGDDEQVLMSNYEEDSSNNDYCEIRITPTDIILHLHSDDEIIQHSCKDWTTLFVECNSDSTTTYFKYDVNGVTGSFSRPCSEMMTESVALGSRYDNTHFLHGQVSALEFYQINQPSEIPVELKDIVIKNQKDTGYEY